MSEINIISPLQHALVPQEVVNYMDLTHETVSYASFESITSNLKELSDVENIFSSSVVC